MILGVEAKINGLESESEEKTHDWENRYYSISCSARDLWAVLGRVSFYSVSQNAELPIASWFISEINPSMRPQKRHISGKRSDTSKQQSKRLGNSNTTAPFMWIGGLFPISGSNPPHLWPLFGWNSMRKLETLRRNQRDRVMWSSSLNFTGSF